MTDQARYYLVKVMTNASEHKMHSVDMAAARNLHHGFGSDVQVFVFEHPPTLDVLPLRRVLYDPIIDDGHAPPGYVPKWELDDYPAHD